MTKINLDQPILGLDSKPLNSTKEAFVIIRDRITKTEEFLKDPNGNDVMISKETVEDTLTLKKQLINSLLFNASEITPDDKAKRFALFFKIEQCKDEELELTAEEVSLCKKCVNLYASILIAGRVCMLIDPPSSK